MSERLSVEGGEAKIWPIRARILLTGPLDASRVAALLYSEPYMPTYLAERQTCSAIGNDEKLAAAQDRRASSTRLDALASLKANRSVGRFEVSV